MNISGIVVGTAPGRWDAALASLRGVEGVVVHHLHPASHRLVVTQETATGAEQEAGLRRIQALEGVAYAALVYHAFEDEPGEARS